MGVTLRVSHCLGILYSLGHLVKVSASTQGIDIHICSVPFSKLIAIQVRYMKRNKKLGGGGGQLFARTGVASHAVVYWGLYYLLLTTAWEARAGSVVLLFFLWKEKSVFFFFVGHLCFFGLNVCMPPALSIPSVFPA